MRMVEDCGKKGISWDEFTTETVEAADAAAARVVLSPKVNLEQYGKKDVRLSMCYTVGPVF